MAGFLLLLFGSLVLAGCAARSTVPVVKKSDVADWERLTRLQRRTMLKVLTTSSAVTGRFVSAERGQLRILVAGSEVAIVKSDVQRISVQRLTPRQRAKRGFAFGALAGGLVGAFTTKSNRVPWTAFMAVGWGGIGALIGALDSIGSSSEVVLYISQPSTSQGSRPGAVPRS